LALYALGSQKVMPPIPLSPARILDQQVGKSDPNAVLIPIPVTTTRCLIIGPFFSTRGQFSASDSGANRLSGNWLTEPRGHNLFTTQV
jgi:hypothetical protein